MFLLKNQENFTKNLDYHPNFASNFRKNILTSCILIVKKCITIILQSYFYRISPLFLHIITNTI